LLIYVRPHSELAGACLRVVQVHDEFRQRRHDPRLGVRATNLPPETASSGAQIRGISTLAVETGPAAAHQLVGLRRPDREIRSSASISRWTATTTGKTTKSAAALGHEPNSFRRPGCGRSARESDRIDPEWRFAVTADANDPTCRVLLRRPRQEICTGEARQSRPHPDTLSLSRIRALRAARRPRSNGDQSRRLARTPSTRSAT
jgi:hypothetical protein